jgi:Tfp pilus assembly protein PilN
MGTGTYRGHCNKRGSMSQRPLQSLPVLEWSPAGVAAYDPATKQEYSGPLASFSAQLSHKDVILVFARRSAFIRAVRMPDAPRNEISQILSMQIGQYFPVPAADLAYDFHLTQDKNEEGRLIVVGAVRTDLLKIALAELKAAGLHAVVVAPAAFGSWLLAQSLGKPDAAVVERRSDGLTVDVIAGGELRYSRVAPPAATEPEIEAEICRTFSVAGVSGGDVIAAGGLAYKEAAVAATTTTLEGFSLGGAERIGLSIELPERRLERERREQGQRMRLVALLLAAAVGIWTFIYFDRAENAQREDRNRRRWTSQINQAKKDIKAADALSARQGRIADTIKLAFRPAQRFSDVLTIAGNVTPGSIWLTGITAERGRPITMRGTAINSEAVAAYMQRLSADPRFRDVSLVFANNATIEDKPIVQFAISAHALGNLPIQKEKGSK